MLPLAVLAEWSWQCSHLLASCETTWIIAFVIQWGLQSLSLKHTRAWSPNISSVSLILTDGLNHLCILDCILPQLLLSVFTLCCLHDLLFTLNLHKLFAASFPTPPAPPLGSALPRSHLASPQRCLIYFNLMWCYFIWRAVTSDGSAGIWGGGSTACAIRHTPQHPLSMHTAYVHLCARQKTFLGKN